VCFAGLLVARVARAQAPADDDGTARQACPAPAGNPGLAQIDPQTRMLFLLRALDQNAGHLQTWSLIWGTTYAAAMPAQLVALPLVHGPVRIDLTAGAIAAGVGTASLYLLPLRITSQAGLAHKDVLDPDPCVALARVEARFFETAEIDRLSGGWIAHAGNVAINTALALILGVGYGRWVSALISAIVGLSVGEANLLTQPHELVSAERGYLSLGAPPQAAGEGTSPLLGGLAIGW
jgi:hypothetical protein